MSQQLAEQQSLNSSPREKASAPKLAMTLQLNSRGAVSVEPTPSPVRVRVEAGIAWMTVDGDGVDIVLRPGDEHDVQSEKHVVLQALRGDAVVTVTSLRAA